MPRRLRTRRRQTSDDCCTECCATCCCCFCWGRSFIQRKSRIKMLWIYMLLSGLFTGVILGMTLYGSVFTELTVSDMKIIDRKFSHLFCNNINLDTTNSRGDFALFSAYLINTPVTIDTSYQEKVDFETSFTFDKDSKYVLRKFFLLSESSVQIRCWTTRHFIEIIVVKGEQNFTELQNSGDFQCMDCIYARVTFDITHSGPFSWTFPDTDEYYFVVLSYQSTWASCQFELNRSLYNIANSVSSCFKVSTCEFGLDITENDNQKQVVVKLEPESEAEQGRYIYSTSSVHTSCVARLWFYLVVFLGCPFAFCIIVSVLIYKLCSDPTDIENDDDDSDTYPDERSPLLWDSGQHYSGTLVTEPPKYEDIMAADREGLPSYEEAVACGVTTVNNSDPRGCAHVQDTASFGNTTNTLEHSSRTTGQNGFEDPDGARGNDYSTDCIRENESASSAIVNHAEIFSSTSPDTENHFERCVSINVSDSEFSDDSN